MVSTPYNPLNKAISIAASAHDLQVDKAGEPYILHPLRVMLSLKTEDERIVAVLHDVLEDSQWTAGDLFLKGFTREQIEAIEALTRHDGEDYYDFVRRAASNPIARRVKLADIEDNLSATRRGSCPERLVERYVAAHAILSAAGGE